MYQVKEVRYFENSRGMVGHNANIYKDGERVASSSHDGDCVVYSIRFEKKEEEKQFIEWAKSAVVGTQWEEFLNEDESYTLQLGAEVLFDEHDSKVMG